jgi:hypothetical protein
MQELCQMSSGICKKAGSGDMVGLYDRIVGERNMGQPTGIEAKR